MGNDINVSSVIFDDPSRKAVRLYAKLRDTIIPIEQILCKCIIVDDFPFIWIIYP